MNKYRLYFEPMDIVAISPDAAMISYQFNADKPDIMKILPTKDVE